MKALLKQFPFLAVILGALVVLSSSVQSRVNLTWQEEFAQKFDNVAIHEIDGNGFYSANELRAAHHATKLSIIRFRETLWTREMVVEHIREIIRTYNTADCRIIFKKIYVVEADPVNGQTYIDWASVYSRKGYPTGIDLKVATMLPESMPRPVVSLFRSIAGGMTGYASPKANATGIRRPLLNTAWISSMINTRTYKKRIPRGYNAIAHELAHIFFNHPYHDANESRPNILSDHTVSDRILPRQCSMFRKSGLGE